MDAHRQKVHDIFSRIANRYDRMNSILSFNLDRHWRKRTLEWAAPASGENWLDVCCGTGKLTVGIRHRMGEGGQVTGLDFNRSMLEIAKKNCQALSEKKQIDWLQADAMNLPFSEASFDGVTIGFGLRNLPDYGLAVAEFRRVLKPGGRFVCLDLARPILPVFRQGHRLFVCHVVPWLGRLSQRGQEDYQWLPESLSKFPEAEELAALLLRQGFKQVRFERLSLGIVSVHCGLK